MNIDILLCSTNTSNYIHLKNIDIMYRVRLMEITTRQIQDGRKFESVFDFEHNFVNNTWLLMDILNYM